MDYMDYGPQTLILKQKCLYRSGGLGNCPAASVAIGPNDIAAPNGAFQTLFQCPYLFWFSSAFTAANGKSGWKHFWTFYIAAKVGRNLQRFFLIPLLIVSLLSFTERNGRIFLGFTFCIISPTPLFKHSFWKSESHGRIGPWWWSSGQRSGFLLLRSKFNSRWLLNFPA